MTTTIVPVVAPQPPYSTTEEELSTSTTALLADKDAEIQHLRTQLALLSEGMRLVATQIRKADRQGTATVWPPKSVDADGTTVATTEESCAGEETVGSTGTDHAADGIAAPSIATTTMNHQGQLDASELRLTEIMQDLTRAQTADLMALQNAVRIVQQHAQLAVQESSTAVQDAVEAQRLVQTWQGQTKRMKQQCRKLQTATTELTTRNAKLTREKRILIQEVRKLRHQESSSQQFHTTVWEAMQLHQEHLKQKTLEGSSTGGSMDHLSHEESTTTWCTVVETSSKDEGKASDSLSTANMSTPPSSPVNLLPRMEVVGTVEETSISPITPGFPTTPCTGSEPPRRKHPLPNEDLMMPRTIF